MKQEKSIENTIKKPSFFLYTIPTYIVKIFARIYWRMRTDNKEIRKLKSPILAVSAHASTFDIVPALCTLLPKRFNIVTAKDLFTWKQLKPFINRFGAIPMSQCSIDLSSIKKMKSAVEQNRNILLFPEGRTSLDGRQMYHLNPSIGKLVKFLDCTVVLIKTDGAYATKPRYIKGFRRGRVDSKASVLFTKEEIKTLAPKQIYERIRDGLIFNDNVWQQENKVRFKAKELASNLNYILYKCPRCGAEYEMQAIGDELACKKCGNSVRLTEEGHLVPIGDSIGLNRIDLWMDYERESIKEELKNEDFRIEKPVKMYRRDDAQNEYIQEGEGDLIIDKEKIEYVGTKAGAEWRAEVSIVNMPTIITKNAEGIDLVIDESTYRFLFTEKKYSTKYGLIVEMVFAERHGINAIHSVEGK